MSAILERIRNGDMVTREEMIREITRLSADAERWQKFKDKSDWVYSDELDGSMRVVAFLPMDKSDPHPNLDAAVDSLET